MAVRVRAERTTYKTAPNGERVAASATELKFYGPDGKLLRTTPNGGPAFQIVNLQHRLGHTLSPLNRPSHRGGAGSGQKPKTADDAILETYITHRRITGYNEREARDVWALFKRLIDNKPLKHCNRDDGRKLVAHFEGQGLKTQDHREKDRMAKRGREPCD